MVDRPSPETALSLLKAGHQRFLDGKPLHPHMDVDHLHALAEQQYPIAAVLGCADSRVPVELLFDTGFGDLFVARNAGNLALAGMVGTLEYAVEVLKVSLIVVLGHERCGAVAAALRTQNLDLLPHSLAQLVGQIRLELLAAGIDRDLDQACRHNAIRAAQRLAGSSVLLNDALRSGQLRIEAARYDLDDSCLDWLCSMDPVPVR
jgi:carbonic anhydrase